MSARDCKLKICICNAVGESENLKVNFDAWNQVLAQIKPTQEQLVTAGIDDVIAAAENMIQAGQKLNKALVHCGVKLVS